MEKFRRKYQVNGIVQGVGFRPLVYRLAKKHGVTGHICNGIGGVVIEVQGMSVNLQNFFIDLFEKDITPARIMEWDARDLELQKEGEFRILPSDLNSKTRVFAGISPDMGVCQDCMRELYDKNDRRYLYPFINCTACGPRFTIITGIPYDRPRTTMVDFIMCDECQKEYDSPENRRHHAQPVACPKCGPQIDLIKGVDAGYEKLLSVVDGSDWVSVAVNVLKNSGILAIKGTGGFHLACDARNSPAVDKLRMRKHRNEKPFAVMFKDIDQVKEYLVVTPMESELLQSSAFPIVILPRIGDGLAQNLAPGLNEIGALLPSTPLHHMLLKEYNNPLVMTSGNLTDEPIVYRSDEVSVKLGKVAELIINHNRPIHVRMDDSVIRPFHDNYSVIRRSRGYAPAPILQTERFENSILAIGGDLKNTVAFGKDNQIILGHHSGDLGNPAALEGFIESISHYSDVYEFTPQVIACDMHPHFFGTAAIKRLYGDSLRFISVQHHFAHIVSCMVENNLYEPVIGVALDGTGYGSDGQILGGEIIIADRMDFIRYGSIYPFPMPGGESSIKNIWRLAMSALIESGMSSGDIVHLLQGQYFGLSDHDLHIIERIQSRSELSPPVSSCGRLFDAMAAISGIRSSVSYEGQAAMELESLARAEIDRMSNSNHEIPHWEILERKGHVYLDWRSAFKSIAGLRASGIDSAAISRIFHKGLIEVLANTVIRASNKTGIKTVALSGGCFYNVVLREGLAESLLQSGFQVNTHRNIPAGDGGIAVGQLVIADNILKGRESCVLQYR